jgi:rubrerythrin
MRVAGFGPTQIAFHMFDVHREAAEAKRAVRLANLYHKGQELAWDGRQVLQDLLAKHGGIHLEPDKRDSLRRLFAIILWGELAAWKISAQLAERIEPLEAKMAATSQAHDEARHFYVMYDYLSELGDVPTEISRPARATLDMVLNTDSLVAKLVGMQLTVEPLALTLFQIVRESGVEPVLCELLRYFEKDEARHVGLGVQFLPDELRRGGRRTAMGAFVFQLGMTFWSLRGLKVLEPDLRRLGIEPRLVLTLGKSKQLTANDMLWNEMGMDRPPRTREQLDRAVDAVAQWMFPEPDTRPNWRARLRRAGQVWRQGGLAIRPGPLL